LQGYPFIEPNHLTFLPLKEISRGKEFNQDSPSQRVPLTSGRGEGQLEIERIIRSFGKEELLIKQSRRGFMNTTVKTVNEHQFKYKKSVKRGERYNKQRKYRDDEGGPRIKERSFQ